VSRVSSGAHLGRFSQGPHFKFLAVASRWHSYQWCSFNEAACLGYTADAS